MSSAPGAPPWAIREATLDDYAPVCALLDELDRLHREQLPWLFQAPPSPPRSPEFYADLLSNPRSQVLVADAGTLVGVAIGLLRSAPELSIFIPQVCGVLDSIGVAAAWRRSGVGSALAHGIEHWAHALGAQWLELGVYDFNAEARRFYERLGYLPLSTKLRKPR